MFCFVERICPVYARRTSLPQIALPSVNFNFKDKDKKYLFERTECFHGFEDALLFLRIDKWINSKSFGRAYSMFCPTQGFEDALSSLIKDVKNIECEHNRMEDMFNKYIFIISQFQDFIFHTFSSKPGNARATVPIWLQLRRKWITKWQGSVLTKYHENHKNQNSKKLNIKYKTYFKI